MDKDSKLSFEAKNSNLGSYGEQLVVNWLIKNGFAIKEQNYRLKYGEIDLIACKDEVIAFIEVKLRKSHYFGLSQVITPSKQRKIIKAAKEYCAKNHFVNKVYRFDVALVEQKENGNFEINYIPNAFNEGYF
jgi:putative endonuclease